MSTTTSSSSSSAMKSPNWLELPADVTAKILMKLSAIDIIESAQKVCLPWRRICKDSSMWRRIDMMVTFNYGDFHNLGFDSVKICRHAVDRSEGQLIEIDISMFATDELLHYIAERSSGLKRLRLVHCEDISDEGLIEAAAKLPFLEELELSYCTISEEALEVVKKTCGLLKSLECNNRVDPYEDVYDLFHDPFYDWNNFDDFGEIW